MMNTAKSVREMRAGEVDLVGNLRKLLSCDESPLAKDDLRTRDPLGTYR